MNGRGQRVTRQRALMTWLVAGAMAITGLAVTGTYWLATRHKETPVALPQNVPVDIHQQLSGYTVTHSDGARRVYTIHAARTVSFKQGGATVLEDVLVELFGKTGKRRDLMRTEQCQYNAQNGDLFSSGPVHIELNSDAENTRASDLKGNRTVYLETSKVSYRHEKSLVTSDEVVHFRVGPATGSSRGMVYSTRDGSLDLEKDVAMEMPPREGHAPGPPMQLSASHLRYEKAGRQITLWGPVRVTQGDQTVSAGGGKVFLNDANRVTRVEMEGSVKASESSPARQVELSADRAQGEFDPAMRALRHLTAQGNVAGQSRDKGSASQLRAERVELNLAGAPAKLQDGDALENVQLVVESSPTLQQGKPARPAAIERRSLAASELKFSFRPDGKSLKDAQTVGGGRLVIDSSSSKAGQRILTAGQLLMAFSGLSELETLRGLAPTRIEFQPPRDAPPGRAVQESTADQLLATFDDATHALKQVVQSGNYTFRDGDRNASADQSVYVAAAQAVTLTGHPRLWDAESRARCERLRFDLASDTAEGTGKVESSHLGNGDLTANGQSRDPTNVLADRMTAQRRGQFVHYEGHVRAWRGADVVESTSLDVYRVGRRMSSGAQVLTSHFQAASAGAGTQPLSGSARRQSGPLTVRADSLEAYDVGSKATYRGHVRLQTGLTTMEGDRMDVYFSRGANQQSDVDRANADGHVVVVQPGRRAQAEHGEYSASTGQILLTGGPPSIRDEKKGFTTGRRLTVFVHDDTLLVEGGDGTPSLSQHRVAP